MGDFTSCSTLKSQSQRLRAFDPTTSLSIPLGCRQSWAWYSVQVWRERSWPLQQSISVTRGFNSILFGDGGQRFRGNDPPMDPHTKYALYAFANAAHIRTVADVSREIGWSRRWFSHAFSEEVGMTPKRYCRLMRFQRVVRQIASGEPVDWVDVALAGGFCDQAHLVHEFRAFSGLSPERYLAAERPFPNHVRTG